MVTLLRKLFIKNYQDVDNSLIRGKHGKLAAIFGIITNLLLVLLKFGIALYGASKNNWIIPLALLGDAINNLGDLASNLVTLIGFKMSLKPADKDHPFGHQRIEYISGLIVSVFVVTAGIELLVTSIKGII
ncbi:MAG TPA: cation-efflux pump, partial [Firmicutes bacterium]|nr:cation-efflux pump [Bacillota bacterium]